jgi:acetyl esterase
MVQPPARPSLPVTWRRHLGAALVDGSFRSLAKLGSLHPKARPEVHGVEVLRDLRYAPGPLEHHGLDVYRPAGLAPRDLATRPLVLYVHGGGFRILSKDTHWVMGLAYARRGAVVVSINYRLAPRHPFPAAIEDVATAFAALPRLAEEHGGSLERLVLAGESAGANLVTALAVLLSTRRPEPFAERAFDLGLTPRAVVPACGVFQITDPERFARRKRLSPFLADRIEEVTRAYVGPRTGDEVALADPLLLLEGPTPMARPLPPFFVPVGTRDPVLDDTRRLAAALRARGVRCDDRYYEGGVHAFHALVFHDLARRCWRDTFSFLDDVLGPP